MVNTAYNIIEAALTGLNANTINMFHERMVKDRDGIHGKHPEESIGNAEDSIKEYAVNDWKFLKPYVKWVVQRYAKGGIRLWEDVLSRTVPALVRFDKLKRTNKLAPKEKDVNRLKSLSDLENLVEKYREKDTSSGKEKSKAEAQGYYDRKEAVLIHDSKKVRIVRPLTEKASNYFGCDTRWCTTGKNNMFNNYKTRGLYILDFKKDPRKDTRNKVQLTGDLEEIMDATDVGMHPDDLQYMLGDKLLGILIKAMAKDRKHTHPYYLYYPVLAKKLLGDTIYIRMVSDDYHYDLITDPISLRDEISNLKTIIRRYSNASSIVRLIGKINNAILRLTGILPSLHIMYGSFKDVDISATKAPANLVIHGTGRVVIENMFLRNINMTVSIRQEDVIEFNNVNLFEGTHKFNNENWNLYISGNKGKPGLLQAIDTANKRGSIITTKETKRGFFVSIKKGVLVL